MSPFSFPTGESSNSLNFSVYVCVCVWMCLCVCVDAWDHDYITVHMWRWSCFLTAFLYVCENIKQVFFLKSNVSSRLFYKSLNMCLESCQDFFVWCHSGLYHHQTVISSYFSLRSEWLLKYEKLLFRWWEFIFTSCSRKHYRRTEKKRWKKHLWSWLRNTHTHTHKRPTKHDNHLDWRFKNHIYVWFFYLLYLCIIECEKSFSVFLVST